MAETLKIVIEDDPKNADIRPNPALDEFMGMGKAPPKIDAATGNGAAKQQPNFPATVLGPDGKAYSLDAFNAAQRKIEGQRKQNAAGDAYDAFFGPPALPKKIEPPPLPGKQPGVIDAIMQQLGGGQIGKMLGLGEAGAAAGLSATGIGAAVVYGAHQLTESFKSLKGQVDAVTHSAAALVENDFAGAQQGLDDFRHQLVGTVPILGDMANAYGDLLESIIRIPEKLDAAFIAQAHKLAPYSGAISSSEAQADVRKIQADIREAQTLGNDMGRLVDAQSRVEADLREMLLPIKKFLIEVLAERLEMISNGIRVIENLPSIIETVTSDGAEAIVLAITGEWTKAGETLKSMNAKLAAMMSRTEADDIWGDFQGFLNNGDAPVNNRPGGGLGGLINRGAQRAATATNGGGWLAQGWRQYMPAGVVPNG